MKFQLFDSEIVKSAFLEKELVLDKTDLVYLNDQRFNTYEKYLKFEFKNV